MAACTPLIFVTLRYRVVAVTPVTAVTWSFEFHATFAPDAVALTFVLVAETPVTAVTESLLFHATPVPEAVAPRYVEVPLALVATEITPVPAVAPVVSATVG